MQSWLLLLDETGSFSALEDRVLVGGLLVPAACQSQFAGLRSRLERELPWLPWPLHASRFNLPVYPAVVAEAWPYLEGMPWFVSEVGRFLSANYPELVAPITDSLRSGTKFPFEIFKALDARLACHEALHAHLSVMRNQAVATLSEELGRLRLAGSGRVTLVLAGETRQGDAIGIPRRWGKAEDDRFLGELACLFRRIADVLTQTGGRHTVSIRICTRGITPKGSSRWVPLDSVVVRQLVEENTGGAPRVVWDEISVHDYERTDSAELVFADFATNVSRRYLWPGERLKNAEFQLEKHLRIPSRFKGGPGSHIAATGVAQQCIESAFGRSEEPAPQIDGLKDCNRWACDQARQWVKSIGLRSRK